MSTHAWSLLSTGLPGPGSRASLTFAALQPLTAAGVSAGPILVVYGGIGPTEVYGDLWVYPVTGATKAWARVAESGVAGRRFHQSSIYLGRNHSVLGIVGGQATATAANTTAQMFTLALQAACAAGTSACLAPVWTTHNLQPSGLCGSQRMDSVAMAANISQPGHPIAVSFGGSL